MTAADPPCVDERPTVYLPAATHSRWCQCPDCADPDDANERRREAREEE